MISMPDYLVSLFKGCATGQQQHSTSSGSETGVSSELNERGPLSYIAGYVLSILKLSVPVLVVPMCKCCAEWLYYYLKK